MRLCVYDLGVDLNKSNHYWGIVLLKQQTYIPKLEVILLQK